MRSLLRRQAIAALAAGTAIVGGAPLARAFRLEPLDARGADAIAAACGPVGDDHRRLVEAIVRDNGDRPEGERLSLDALRDALRRTNCPTCGCVVLAADGELTTY